MSESTAELQIDRLGYEVTSAETHELRQPLEAWLEQIQTPESPAEQIRTALAVEGAGGAVTGLLPQVEGDGSLSIAHTLTSLLVLNRRG